MTKRFCPTCGYTPADDAKNFCYLHGTELVPMVPCECGNGLDLRFDKFCEMCGRAVPTPDKYNDTKHALPPVAEPGLEGPRDEFNNPVISNSIAPVE